MGWIRHHAIVVTCYNKTIGIELQALASLVFPWVSELCPPKINGYVSFFIPPDGSKEGWDESDAGDEQRGRFIGYLEARHDADWVEVCFGDDENGPPCIVNGSGDHRYPSE